MKQFLNLYIVLKHLMQKIIPFYINNTQIQIINIGIIHVTYIGTSDLYFY